MIKPVSERINYKLMTPADSELLFSLDQDPKVMRYINGGNATSREDIENVYIPRLKSFTNQTQGWGLWKLLLKDSEQFIGWVLLRPMEFFTESPQLDNLEIGWRLFQSQWGKGYATEAAQAVCRAIVTANKHGEIDKVKFISAVALEANKGSIGVMNKIGLDYLKTDIHKDPLGDSEAVYFQMAL